MGKKTLFISFLLLTLSLSANAQELKAFKLKNGMSVFIWEDTTKPDVFGEVVVRTGSVNDPEEYTGLAHYLEHVLFKGTQKIGALDWEKEKGIYEQIIQKYDEMSEKTDPAQKEAIGKEINELTIQASNISVSNEFSNLIESIGGTGLNAGTSWDYTVYYNTFPPHQINKWLELASERFVNPVFRTFQNELETVYEEFNRSNNNPSTRSQNFMMKQAFDGHPYSRPIIGLGEHLKNPRLSKLIEFYNNWYVPENMALILVGNVNTKRIMGRIAAAFGKLQSRPVPERKTCPVQEIKGRVQHNTKYSSYPMLSMIYKGVKSGHPDETALEICMQLLSNTSETGLLDKLVVDGQLMAVGATPMYLREQGRNIINAIPQYDEGQRRFLGLKGVEKKLLEAVRKVSNGEFEAWIVEAIKATMCRDFDLLMETNSNKASLLADAFICEQDMNEALSYKDRILQTSIDDIKRVAQEYLSENFLVIYNERGKNDKPEKIKKPGYDPLTPPTGQHSMYAHQFKNMPTYPIVEQFADWSKVQCKSLNTFSKIYYTPNTENDVFTLTLQYGVGTNVFPKLAYAASLMSTAGISGLYEPYELKTAMSRLNATYSVSADENYLYVTLRGYENTLQEACQLITRQLLTPKLDENQLNSLKGSAISSRLTRKEDIYQMADALYNYMLYGDNSPYKKEVPDEQLVYLSIGDLCRDINRVTSYAANIFYTGTMPFDNVYQILSTSLPLVEGEKESQSPVVKKMKEYTENTIYFFDNDNTSQSHIFFYIPIADFNKEMNVKRKAFNQYIDGGFNGIIMNEIREKNSMAYTAYGHATSTALPGSRTYFDGYVATQNDKTVDAVRLYTKLLKDMPIQPERIDNIKNYLYHSTISVQPGLRSLSSYISHMELRGYKDDPAKEELPQIKALTFDDIQNYYNTFIKGKPIVIGIVGNPREINTKELEQFGKVVRLSPKKLFNDEGVIF